MPTQRQPSPRHLQPHMISALACPGLPLRAQEAVRVDPDGTVHVPEQAVPVSPYLSAEGRGYLADHLLRVQDPALLVPYLERQRVLYPVTRTDTSIGGVHVYVYEPAGGIAAARQDKVLINLHGGDFSGGWPACAELESMPTAALAGIKVVSLDYRQAPAHRFPAASEDVAALYRELLKTYAPENIGIYGCSAGGMLTAMAVAWFQVNELPRPGAIGVLCAGAAPTGPLFGGDATYFTLPLGEGRMPPQPVPGPGAAGIGADYLAGTDPNDPLVSPATDPAVLAQFPPTLIVSATRGFDLSNAVHTHIQLAKLDVPAELYVWEGMFHGFFYNPDVPEARECHALIARFFNKWLGLGVKEGDAGGASSPTRMAATMRG